jgi:hypothetical protein
LNLLDVVVDFNWVVPRDRVRVASVFALRVLNDKFKPLQFFKHHWLLAIDHLGSHRIIKICHLLECHTLLVELFSVFSDIKNWFGYLKPMLS